MPLCCSCRKCVTCTLNDKIITSAQLWVDDPPAFYVECIKDLNTTERDNVIIECQLSRANTDVEWWKGDELLHETQRIIFICDGVYRRLLIDDIQLNEASEYTNRVVGQDTKCSARVTVTGLLFNPS